MQDNRYRKVHVQEREEERFRGGEVDGERGCERWKLIKRNRKRRNERERERRRREGEKRNE
jgi:hypothetical protein